MGEGSGRTESWERLDAAGGSGMTVDTGSFPRSPYGACVLDTQYTPGEANLPKYRVESRIIK